MADWPSLDELKGQLGITVELPPEREVTLQRALDAARNQVLIDTSIEYLDEPPDEVSAAALLLAVRIVKAPDAPFGVAAVFDAGGIYKAVSDPDYRRLLKGHRAAFGIA